MSVSNPSVSNLANGVSAPSRPPGIRSLIVHSISMRARRGYSAGQRCERVTVLYPGVIYASEAGLYTDVTREVQNDIF